MESTKQKRIQADMMLLTVTLFWGSSYLLIDYCLEELSAFNINVLRFSISFITLFVLLRKKLFPVSKETIRYSAILGFIVMFTYLMSTLGVKYTSLSNAGFLCSLTVVFTPVLGFFFKGQRPERRLLLAVVFAILGIAFMTLTDGLIPALGDILCILCALSYAILLLITETAVCNAKVKPFQLGIYQVAFAGIFQLALALPTERLRLPQSPKVWISIFVLTFLCTGMAFIVQSVALQYTTASRAGIIFSLEPVFAALIAFFIAGEILSARGYMGAALLMMSLLVMEIDLKPFLGSRKRKKRKLV